MSGKKQKTIHQSAINLGFGLLVFLTIIAGLVIVCDYYYKNRFIPLTKIGDIPVSGLSQQQAKNNIQAKIDEIEYQGIQYQYNDLSVAVTPTVVSLFDKDASRRFIYFNLDSSLSHGFAKGHTGSFIKRTLDLIDIYLNGHSHPIEFEISEQELKDLLKNKFEPYEQRAINANLVVLENKNITIEREKMGSRFDYDLAVKKTIKQLKHLDLSPISMELLPEIPDITTKDLEKALELAKQVIEKDRIKLVYNNQEWILKNEQFKNWLTLKKRPAYAKSLLEKTSLSDFIQDPKAWLIFDPQPLEKYLNLIAKEINVPAQDAKFILENNRVIEFQTSLPGTKLDIPQTVQHINDQIINQNKSQADLAVIIDEPKITTENVNNLGIKEIIGIGTSDFKHSPPNRIHNIHVGAAAVNGTLIKPGEEFSLVQTLGEINADSGYKPELVIKGNKTVPEYGGGLCQIGTTAFRAAINTGLKITERHNHSYRVSYYEPAGTDATIYNPWPDLKFINDTEHSILIQSKIQNTTLTFEFWGTHDGRVVEISEPVIYNQKAPPPTKIIETEDLKPGQKKCTEHAHYGADAKFDYKITYANGDIHEETFKSHYIPWQEVCLIGKEIPTQEPEPDPENALPFDPEDFYFEKESNP